MLPEYTTNQSLDVDDVEEKEKTTSRSEKFERIVEFSPEMSAYREELRKVLHTLDTVGARGLIFDTVLLVAIDDGWGFSELVEMISYELKEAFDLQHTIIYKAKEKYITDKREGSWSRQQDKIEQLSDRANRGERFAVLTYDLSDAMPQFGTPEFMQNIADCQRILYIICPGNTIFFHLIRGKISFKTHRQGAAVCRPLRSVISGGTDACR